MIKPTPCPICGQINNREYEMLRCWVQEDYYSCKVCGYYSEMCADLVHFGFTLRAKKSFKLSNIKSLFTQVRMLIKYRNKAWPIIRNNALDIVRKWAKIQSPSERYLKGKWFE